MQDDSIKSKVTPSPPLFPRWLSPIVLGVFVIFTYWLYGYRPIAAYPQSYVDDGLYLRHGHAFVNWLYGNNPNWLGDYDCFLFAKAPLYGIFLGVLNLLCVPVRIGEFILLLGVPLLFSAACRPLILIRGWSFLVVSALLMWLPLLPSDTHLQRMGLQATLTSYLIIASIGLVLRFGGSARHQWRWAGLLGFIFSLNYLNREEAAWVALVIAFSFLLFCLLSRLNGYFSWPRVFMVALVLGFSAAPLILLVSSLNYRSYGVFMTTIRRSNAFTSAYQRLTSLEPELHKRYVPISRETRFRAYDLSPTFGRLKPIMEGHGTYWVAGIDDHSALNGYSPADNEFFVSNYEFALEYAASFNGATNALETEKFFSAVEQELSGAVQAGRIKAGLHGPAILAAPVKGDITRIIQAWWESLRSLLVLKRAGLDWSARSAGEARSIEETSLFVHSSLLPEPADSLQYKLRFQLVALINQLLRLVYWSSIPVMLAVSIVSFKRSRVVFFQGPVVASVPLLALALFCLTMAVVDTLGFPFLGSMSYNVIGYSPISVLCAFTVVLVLGHFRRSSPQSKAI